MVKKVEDLSNIDWLSLNRVDRMTFFCDNQSKSIVLRIIIIRPTDVIPTRQFSATISRCRQKIVVWRLFALISLRQNFAFFRLNMSSVSTRSSIILLNFASVQRTRVPPTWGWASPLRCHFVAMINNFKKVTEMGKIRVGNAGKYFKWNILP